jgi:hypothetical protein
MEETEARSVIRGAIYGSNQMHTYGKYLSANDFSFCIFQFVQLKSKLVYTSSSPTFSLTSFYILKNYWDLKKALILFLVSSNIYHVRNLNVNLKIFIN